MFTDTSGTPTAELAIILTDGEHGVVVCLDGRLNVDSSPAFRDQLLAILLEQSPKNLTVDLARVSYIDSSGIATLIQGLKIARQHRIGLHLRGLEGRLLHLFEATGVLGLFATDGGAASPASRVS